MTIDIYPHIFFNFRKLLKDNQDAARKLSRKTQQWAMAKKEKTEKEKLLKASDNQLKLRKHAEADLKESIGRIAELELNLESVEEANEALSASINLKTVDYKTLDAQYKDFKRINTKEVKDLKQRIEALENQLADQNNTNHTNSSTPKRNGRQNKKKTSSQPISPNKELSPPMK